MGYPLIRAGNIIAVISPTKNDITFIFYRGVEFEDRYRLLQRKGKVSKHVKIRTVQDIDRDALRYYIRQALDFDAG